MKKPNILFLMSDEHRADVSGFAGNDIVRTPVLDWLAQEGIVFTNAYTPAPICIPARPCMMSGKLPRSCGVERYGDDLPPGSLTFARQLVDHGYEAAVSGKLHHMGTDQMQGWSTRISGDMTIDARYLGESARAFRHTQTGRKWSDTKEVARAGVGRGPCANHDEYAVYGAVQYIDNYFCSPYYDREQVHPLLLKVSLLQPHYPYFTSEEKFTYYLNRVRPYGKDEGMFDHPFLNKRQVRVGIDADEREIRRATAAYYGMVETIDDHYGRVLNALRHAGHDLDDWIIVYTSDHGEMLGQHGIWEKQKFFEASVRVPLIIRFPRRFRSGGRVEANVNLCDLFATLCELTEVPIPAGLDSRSLVPLMEGKAKGWMNETVSQFNGTNLMIKRDHLKYQYYGENMPEVLFDLERDPDERANFLSDPVYADRLAAFRQRRAALGFGPDADVHYAGAGYSGS